MTTETMEAHGIRFTLKRKYAKPGEDACAKCAFRYAGELCRNATACQGAPVYFKIKLATEVQR